LAHLNLECHSVILNSDVMLKGVTGLDSNYFYDLWTTNYISSSFSDNALLALMLINV